MRYFQISGLIVWIAFYGCYVAGIFGRRRQEVRTERLAGKNSDHAWHTEKTLRRSIYAIAFIQLCSMFISDPAITVALTSPYRLAGLGLALLGATIFYISMYAIRDGRQALVTNGIYRYSRNPAFAGFDLLYAGLALTFCNWLLIFISLTGMVLMHLQIIEEEKHLSARFGEAYQVYRKRTPRYFLFF
ncbi:MAG: isoprenylcysteine carboxylmethyltransferase family protein [Tannerella sp.]|jgi:protein-S-isoprenylcysteine O-methyltransferase Ste14|nr:isoprenylcysteine carboxylmethyltransferase family protein [Tannerella sp.]